MSAGNQDDREARNLALGLLAGALFVVVLTGIVAVAVFGLGFG